MAVNNIETLTQGIGIGVNPSGNNNTEVDGIEILVNMAKQGKIDPWNVDIVDVYDNYMIQMFKAKGQNLKMTGRTILFAAILLKLKSNSVNISI
jgi:segregation and condensation protein A